MKILIVYGSFGSGHRRAAEAMLEAFQDRGVCAETRDLLEFLPRPMARFYSTSYDFMITGSRRLWRFTYELGNSFKSPYRPATAVTQKWQFNKLLRYFQQNGFTHAVCTHFTPAALFTDWRAMGQVKCGLFTIITDHESHRCWKRTGIDHYFVASGAVAAEMEAAGIHRQDITVSGIPISKDFLNLASRESLRSDLKLPQNEILVLVMCSALKVRKSIEMLNDLRSSEKRPHYVVVAGSNQKLQHALKEYFGKDKGLILFGFTRRMAELMKACDLIVTKPGGLIVSEALAAGLPQLLLEPIPGQEEANARFVTDCGAAVCINEKKGMYAARLIEILNDPHKLQQMREAAQNAARPQAAMQIAETILSRFVV